MDFELLNNVAERSEALSFVEGAATVGFDGFTDTIVRVVESVAPDRSARHFTSKRAFGEKIIGLGSHNASFDLTEVATKIGGNAPNTAQAFGRLGLRVDCIGMLGRPEIHAVFGAMDPHCRLHSFANPTQTTALEFHDGKVLLAGNEVLRTIDWPAVRDLIGLQVLTGLYQAADIIAFANWGEIEHATEIWEGIEREVLAEADPQKRRIVLIDLADLTKRDRDFDRLAMLIGRLTEIHETVLSLNRNEAQAVAHALAFERDSRPEELGAAIYAAMSVDTLIIHDPHDAIAWTSAGLVRAGTFHVPVPRLSTGGGDNFNAGYCFARLAGFDTQSALVVGSAVAGHYIATGESPTRSEVIAFLRERAAAGTHRVSEPAR
jgi:hypothetical protein